MLIELRVYNTPILQERKKELEEMFKNELNKLDGLKFIDPVAAYLA